MTINLRMCGLWVSDSVALIHIPLKVLSSVTVCSQYPCSPCKTNVSYSTLYYILCYTMLCYTVLCYTIL